MSSRIAVPIFRVSCNVGIDRGRPWSVMEELLLWAVTRKAKAVGELCVESSLPRQIVVAAIARLMRFRLVEVSIESDIPAFRASEYGVQTLKSGQALPHFPTRYHKAVSFVVCKATGEVFATRDVRVMSDHKLKIEQGEGRDTRVVEVIKGGPVMSNEANIARLSAVSVHRLDEELATVDDRTVSVRADEFMLVKVSGQEMRGLPPTAGSVLRQIVMQTAALPPGERVMEVEYQGSQEVRDANPVWRACAFEKHDLVIGSSEQMSRLVELLQSARHRVVMHSTFLRVEPFKKLLEPLRAACRQGVTFDTFWGAESDETTIEKNLAAAVEIMSIAHADPDLRGRFRIHLRSTGSHAKLMLVETADSWLAVVSTCNWLYSDFESAVEMSAVLREPSLVADVAMVLQRLIGPRGLADPIATEMARIARHLRATPQRGGGCRAAIVSGEQHEGLMRSASSASERQFLVGTNRLGSTARPGALMPAEVAARRHDQVTVLYTRPSGPVKNRHTKVFESEEELEGVRLVRTRRDELKLHAKFVAWDDDDLLVTSLNWGSAAADVDFPWGEVGLHINAPGIGAHTVARMRAIFPELDG